MKERNEMSGVDLIAAERQRQIDLGYDAAHDLTHAPGTFAREAGLYAERVAVSHLPHLECIGCGRMQDEVENEPGDPPEGWPKDGCEWKPGSDVRTLVKAGALAAAEIDRLLATSSDEGAQRDE